MTDDLRFMADKLALWREHPAQMVRDLFKVEPDAWQEEVLEAFPTQPRIAMQASKGVGKTGTEAWLIWNFLLTRSQPKIACVAISADNLADNLWTELAFWRGKSKLLIHLFEWTKTRIFAREHPETWWCSARSWAKTADASQQADTLAGLHADYIMFVLDESGGMPEAIMASAEAALSSCVEGHIVQAGNPTHLTGALYSACFRDQKMWKIVKINSDPDDPKRSPRVSKIWAQEQIDKHGRDNPWVLVNVFGQFPPSSFNALIGRPELEEAAHRYYRQHEIGNAPKILGVDVARYGDDSSVILPRWGIQCMPKAIFKNLDSIQGAAAVARSANLIGADAIFVDATGGMGAGWVDQLRVLNYAPIGIEFSSRAHDHGRYHNKRTEMYFDAVQWIKDGGAIPNDIDLINELAATTYTFAKNRDQMIIEPKEMVKARMGKSPDTADAFILTFAEPVLPKASKRQARHESNYDPMQRGLDEMVRSSYGEQPYDPLDPNRR